MPSWPRGWEGVTWPPTRNGRCTVHPNVRVVSVCIECHKEQLAKARTNAPTHPTMIDDRGKNRA